MLSATMRELQRKEFKKRWETDYSYAVKDVARFRVNAFTHDRGAGAAFRTIPDKVSTLAGLNAPGIFSDLARWPRGSVLVTGPRGPGQAAPAAAHVTARP